MQSGWNLAVVHGGGPDISRMLKTLQIETEFVDGQRKTTKPSAGNSGNGLVRDDQ